MILGYGSETLSKHHLDLFICYNLCECHLFLSQNACNEKGIFDRIKFVGLLGKTLKNKKERLKNCFR